MAEHIVQAVTIRWYNACAYYAVALSRGLVAKGHRVTLTGGPGSPALVKARDYGIPVERFENAGSGPLNSIRLIGAYRRFALEEGVGLVNVHTGSDHLLWSLALRGTGIPIIRTSGNQVPPNVHPGSRFLLGKTAGIIVSCNTIRRYYTDGFGYIADDIPVIQGGVDCDYYAPGNGGSLMRQTAGIPEDAFVFGILARYSPDKGHEYFFRAAEIAAQRFPDAWFLVAGWKAQLREDDMRRMAKDAGIADRTVFMGKHTDSREIIGCIDAGVIASVGSETICRIAMEYMAMGVPVVATDTNVIPEVIYDGVTGIVVPARNHERMAEAMCAFAGSREYALSLGEKGRRSAEKEFSLDVFAEKTLNKYREFMVHA